MRQNLYRNSRVSTFSFTSFLTGVFFILTGCSHSEPPNRFSQNSPLPTKLINQDIQSNTPLSDKVNNYLRLLQADGGTTEEYERFLTQNIDWPNRTILFKRLQTALQQETNPAVISRICNNQPLNLPSALVFCAQQTKPTAFLIERARNTWINGARQLSDEQLLLNQFNKYFTTEDQWKRFDTLISNNALSAASRQIKRLKSDQQNLANVRLAFIQNDSNAETLFAKLDKNQQSDPALTYNHLRWLRLQMREDEAIKLWQSQGFEAERILDNEAFWNERNRLIRALIDKNNYKDAYLLSTAQACSINSCKADSAFLAGWIALRRLNKPGDASNHFLMLTKANSVLTLSRGYYWLGRARQIAGDAEGAKKAWEQAATYPTSFYGQLAISSLHHRKNILFNADNIADILKSYLNRIEPISWTQSDLNSFKNNELFQAAQILVQQDDRVHARIFLLRLNQLKNDAKSQAINAFLASQMNMPEDAVAIARNASSKGIITLLKDGWPIPYTYESVILPKGLALGIMRQESGFNPTIVSRAKAYGLMQLLPSTARQTATQIGLPATMGNPGNLVVPKNNIKLGTAFLSKLMTRFNNVVPYAVAGYNAGPRRVDQWLESNGDPTQNSLDQDQMIDWIELIPITETRNYVQRVLENTFIYQAIENE